MVVDNVEDSVNRAKMLQPEIFKEVMYVSR